MIPELWKSHIDEVMRKNFLFYSLFEPLPPLPLWERVFNWLLRKHDTRIPRLKEGERLGNIEIPSFSSITDREA